MSHSKEELVKYLVDQFDTSEERATTAVEEYFIDNFKVTYFQGKSVEDTCEHIYNTSAYWEPI